MNDKFYEAALTAITKLFNDQSVSIEQARNNLESLKEEIEILLETIEGEE